MKRDPKYFRNDNRMITQAHIHCTDFAVFEISPEWPPSILFARQNKKGPRGGVD